MLKKPKTLEPLKIVFMGTASFAVPALEKLIQHEKVIAVYTQPDRPRGRGQKLDMSPIKKIAVQHGIACYQPVTLTAPSHVKALKALAPDLMVVTAYGLFLPKDILDIPRLKTLNIHPSLLPKYRGAAPIQWAIIQGEEKTGVSIVYVTPEMDAGDILNQKNYAISMQDTYETLEPTLAELGASLLLETIDQIKKNKVAAKPQDPNQVTRAPKLTKEMGTLDWQAPAQQILNLIRGANPWPGTYTFLKDSVLKIHAARVIDPSTQGQPGKIRELSKQGILVETSQGLLLLTEVQKPNKKRIPATEFLKGEHLLPGQFFKSTLKK
ncbi:MAG: methionyl-tRNA formyltransferase [Deltaproteobacteria bacterium]|nr:methionyl-tRNA formyltransferase [Deltaproteobacteria bacterium]